MRSQHSDKAAGWEIRKNQESIAFTRSVQTPWDSPIVSMCAVSQKKNFFNFLVAVNNSIKVGPLVFLLKMFVITETPCIRERRRALPLIIDFGARWR